jgi:hypothetical protein
MFWGEQWPRRNLVVGAAHEKLVRQRQRVHRAEARLHAAAQDCRAGVPDTHHVVAGATVSPATQDN